VARLLYREVEIICGSTKELTTDKHQNFVLKTKM
jgi:hypothetical protein